MNAIRSAATVVILLACSMASPASFAQKAPDNSARNSQQGKTADSQPNDKQDRLTTAKVRKALIADKELSTYGHNVKIITMKGVVTLKGPVRSEEEKQKIMADAAGVVTGDRIGDQLTIKK